MNIVYQRVFEKKITFLLTGAVRGGVGYSEVKDEYIIVSNFNLFYRSVENSLLKNLQVQ